MTHVNATVDIDRDADTVFAFIADMANNPQWQKGQVSCTWTSDAPLRLGSTYDQVAQFLGRRIVSSFVVEEFEPGRLIRITTTSGTMPIDVTRTVEPLDAERCRVSAVVSGDPSGVFKLIDPVISRIVASSVNGDYRQLKDLLETKEGS